MRTTPSGALVTGALVASALSLFVALRMQADATRAARSAGWEDVHVAALRERVAGLERQLESLRALAPAAGLGTEPGLRRPAPEDPESADGTSDLLAVVEGRLNALERLVSDLPRVPPDQWRWNEEEAAAIRQLLAELESGRDQFPNIEWLSSLEDALSLDAVRRLQALAADAAASPDARIEALAALNQAGGRLGTELLDEATAAAALELALASGDERVRRGVYSALEGRTYPFLREPFLRAARDDQAPAVRDDAVSALGHFLPDPQVEELLRWIRDNDPTPGVRDEADETLEKHGRR